MHPIEEFYKKKSPMVSEMKWVLNFCKGIEKPYNIHLKIWARKAHLFIRDKYERRRVSWFKSVISLFKSSLPNEIFQCQTKGPTVTRKFFITLTLIHVVLQFCHRSFHRKIVDFTFIECSKHQVRYSAIILLIACNQ